MSTTDKNISIIIINYNTCRDLEVCLNSLLRYEFHPQNEIIVVDNNSTDGSDIMVKSKFPQVHLIRNNENVGYAKACNTGIKASMAKYVVIVNSDIIFIAPILDKIAEFITKNKINNLGVIGCKILNGDKTLQYSFGNFPTLWSAILDIFKPAVKRKVSANGYDTAHEVDWITGAFMFIDKTVISNNTYFDETYFMYYEETDWCLQIKKKGWKIFYYPDVKIIHKNPHAQKKENVSTRIASEIRYSQLYYFKKNRKYPEFIALCVFTVFLLLIRLFILYIFYIFNIDKYRDKYDRIKTVLTASLKAIRKLI
jgi:GT2 family glycosyltransferase